MLTAVDHVQLAAPPGSEPRLRTYYVDVLGMTEIPKPPALAGAAGSRRGPCNCTSGWRWTSGPPARRTRGCGSTTSRGTPPASKSYAPVTWDDDLPGHRRFFSEDPVGNRLEFLEPVSMVSGPDV